VHQEFNEDFNVQVNRDENGNVRELVHTDQPFVSQAPTAQLAAAEYLNTYGDLIGIKPEETNNLALTREAEPVDAPDELRFYTEKQQFDTTTVAYQQTAMGLPVWHGGVSVQMRNGPYRVVSAQSTRHPDVDVKRPSDEALSRAQKINPTTLARILGLRPRQTTYDRRSLAIERVDLVIYRYRAARRVIVEEPDADAGFQAFTTYNPTLPLPAVAAGIEEGRHYVAAEVRFALAPRGQQQPLHWVAIVDVETLSVLYLRAFVDDVNGMVFRIDPVTTNGGPPPNGSLAALNAVRSAVALDGLAAPVNGTVSLNGNNVKLTDPELPTQPSPTEPTGTDFNFDARTNNFAAVNAYYHCDGFFRLVDSLGFNLASYFGAATVFPNAVDHRGLGSPGAPAGNLINAHCLGTSGGLGILQTTFALADTSDTVHPLGIACDRRVVFHELGGHGVLYPHVHSPNFGFGHSAGDSVAAITSDPDSHAPDRFVTFPWVDIGRRHDRKVADGWGWGSDIALNPFDPILDRGGYKNEQILCTTHFRMYLAMGGGSTDLGMRQFAARFAVYLILRAIGTLTPATNPSSAAGFATALMTADLGDWISEGHAGGAYGKVIRWAFEKQGLFQPAGTPMPNNNEGAPPPVDVYIEDGRHGEYQFQPNHWSCHAIWNRRLNDGGTAHEEPIVGVTNFAFVTLKNRGTQAATNVIVKAFHARPGIGLVYPNDWQPMTTAQLSAADVPPNSATEVTVGPFEWVPSQVGHECMFMVASANGDQSNISNMTAGDAIPEWRLVPNDNNIGQRNVFPVAGGGGIDGLLATLDGQQIAVKNPLNGAARVIVEATLPRFLVAKDWKVAFANPGEGTFNLQAGEATSVTVKLVPGANFTADDVRNANNPTIHIVARANGIVVGGMSYELDPAQNGPAH
jgi:hypothetical protein